MVSREVLELFLEDELEDYEEMLDEMYAEEERELKIHQQGEKTVAVEYGHEYDGIQLIMKRYPWVNLDWLIENGKFHVNDKVVAIVKCHKDDEYNEKVGREEAVKKLNKMILNQREKAVEKFEKYIKKQVENPAAKKKMK